MADRTRAYPWATSSVRLSCLYLSSRTFFFVSFFLFFFLDCREREISSALLLTSVTTVKLFSIFSINSIHKRVSKEIILHVSSALVPDFFSSDNSERTHDILDIVVWTQTTTSPCQRTHLYLEETPVMPIVRLDSNIDLFILGEFDADFVLFSSERDFFSSTTGQGPDHNCGKDRGYSCRKGREEVS